MKQRYLFYHDESEGIFEAHLDEAELEKFYSTADGALCYDVTGKPSFEVMFQNETNIYRATTPILKRKDIMKGLKVFLLAIAAACTEFAEQVEGEVQQEQTQEGAETKSSKKAAKKVSKKASKKTTKPEEDEEDNAADEDMTEEESPYSKGEDEGSEDEEDDFAGMPEDEEDEEEKPKAATTEDLRTALVEHATKHGKPSAYDILAKFKGAKKANEVKGADIEKCIKLLKAKKK